MKEKERELLNIIFELYFAVFAIFASILITEIMGSVVLILFWKQAKSKVLEYVVPIWEVTGTFGAFLVVMSDFAYPYSLNSRCLHLCAAAYSIFDTVCREKCIISFRRVHNQKKMA